MMEFPQCVTMKAKCEQRCIADAPRRANYRNLSGVCFDKLCDPLLTTTKAEQHLRHTKHARKAINWCLPVCPVCQCGISSVLQDVDSRENILSLQHGDMVWISVLVIVEVGKHSCVIKITALCENCRHHLLDFEAGCRGSRNQVVSVINYFKRDRVLVLHGERRKRFVIECRKTCISNTGLLSSELLSGVRLSLKYCQRCPGLCPMVVKVKFPCGWQVRGWKHELATRISLATHLSYELFARRMEFSCHRSYCRSRVLAKFELELNERALGNANPKSLIFLSMHTSLIKIVVLDFELKNPTDYPSY